MHTKDGAVDSIQDTDAPEDLGTDGAGGSKLKNRTFRSVFENTGTGTILIEEDMTISLANGGFEAITGLPRTRVEDRMKLIDFVHPDDRARLMQYHQGRRRGQRIPIDYQCRITSPENGLRHMAVRAQLISGTSRSVVSFMDITDLVCSKQDLERSEQRLAALMSNLPGMAYRYWADGQYTLEFASEGCFRLTGYRPEQLTGGQGPSYADLINPDERKTVLAAVERALRGKKSFQLTYRIQTASGEEKWVWEQGRGTYSKEGELLAVEGFVTDFTQHKEMEQELRRQEARLRIENERLRSPDGGTFGDLVGDSEPMRQVYRLIQQAAEIDVGVVIYGESGTGKELAARQIHRVSARAAGRFVPVNCGAVPEAIFESEFFGYKKGAFSGAERDTEGYLDVADGGTLFLDEVGEISLGGQVKLLRVIDGGGYTPVGGRREKHPNLRIIAATNKDLKRMVENGEMREDFFFRIHVFPITMPSLRDRKEDIPLLIDWLLRACGLVTMPPPTGAALRRLIAYDWPGNVRELQNVLHRYMSTRTLDFFNMSGAKAPMPVDDLPFTGGEAQTLREAVQQFEHRYIRRLLDQHRWHRAKVARILGVDRRTLLRKIRNLGID